MRLLLNASNLHFGGGVAVASSVIDEISRMPDIAASTTVLASPSVAANNAGFGTQSGAFEGFHVHSTHGLSALWSDYPVDPRDFDQILNIFGPVYNVRMARKSVMGFAQPWIAFPDNPAYDRLRPLDRWATRMAYIVKALWFLPPSTLVVEQHVVAKALRSRRLFRNKDILVVQSAVDTVFWDPERWEPVELAEPNAQLRLGLVARNYPHKNLTILPEVKRLLASEFGLEAEILVTLTPEEWSAQSRDFRNEMVNAGPLTLGQCPSFISQLDAVVFPTLLECFSASPIEAQAVGVPLFASDIPVIRETVGDYATYFDPLDPRSIAASIAGYFRAPWGDESANLSRSSKTARQGSSARRARELIRICQGNTYVVTEQRSR